MGRAAVILVLGFTVIVGIIAQSVTERTTEAQRGGMLAFETIQARNIAKSAQEVTFNAVRYDSSLNGMYAVKNLLGGEATVILTEKEPGDRGVLLLNVSAKYGAASRDLACELNDVGSWAPPVTGVAGISFRSKASVKMSKNTFIDGNNHDINGNLSTVYDPISGISLGHPDQLANLIYKLKDVRIKGRGSVEPNVEVKVTQRDYYAWAMKLAAKADVTFTGKQISKKEIPTLGTVTQPQITYVNGRSRFNDEVVGAGILIVNGSCEFRKTIDFTGLIIAVGDSIHSESTGFGGKGSQILGAVMIAGKTTNVKFGDIDLWYSYEAVRMAFRQIGTRMPRTYEVQNVWE